MTNQARLNRQKLKMKSRYRNLDNTQHAQPRIYLALWTKGLKTDWERLSLLWPRSPRFLPSTFASSTA
ncbi:uncharacterized protein LOC143213445 isoform X2 [Lasioglossum baleicum]|uniref:uncharacterized protein LOC143213445 isoform X2 n=1 Tax=Lasioglossum baleicum TaxID=434251 RepID=UPI003FCC79B7